MQEEIRKAVKLLEDNGYAVVKLTSRQEADRQHCLQLDSTGGVPKDCSTCSCSVCLFE